MVIDKEKIISLNNVSSATQEAGLGDIILSLLDKNGGTKSVSIEYVENSKAVSIKELVNDYNKLLNALRTSGLMKKAE